MCPELGLQWVGFGTVKVVSDPNPFTQEDIIPVPFIYGSRRWVFIPEPAVPVGPDPFTRTHNKRKKYINKYSNKNT